nr:uncharacterized protein LOC106679822 [Halyomorpha halys]
MEDTQAEGPKKRIIQKYTSYTSYYLQSIKEWNKMLLLGILLLYFVPFFMNSILSGNIDCSENFEGILTVTLMLGSWMMSISFLLLALHYPSRAVPTVVQQPSTTSSLT